MVQRRQRESQSAASQDRAGNAASMRAVKPVEQCVDLRLGSGVDVPVVRHGHPGMAGVAQQPKIARFGAVALDVVDLGTGGVGV